MCWLDAGCCCGGGGCVLCSAVKGLCLLLQHLSGVLGKLQPGPRQETLPSAECKHALFNGDPAFAILQCKWWPAAKGVTVDSDGDMSSW